MNKGWMAVIIGACFEVGWVIGLKHANSLLEWGATLVAIIVSFYVLIFGTKSLPVGTAYSVFVGLGTAGTVVTDIIIFDAPVQPAKLVLIGTMLLGVIGLKLLDDKASGNKAEDNTTSEVTNP